MNANLGCISIESTNPSQCSDLGGANLHDADLGYANLRGADLSNTDLSSADFRSADLSNAILLSTDFRQATSLTQQQLGGVEQPFLCNVALPKEIQVDPNRDCNRLPQELFKRYPQYFKSLEEARKEVYDYRRKKWE